MITQNTNFKTISGKTQKYDLLKNPSKKYYISWIYLFKMKKIELYVTEPRPW